MFTTFHGDSWVHRKERNTLEVPFPMQLNMINEKLIEMEGTNACREQDKHHLSMKK